MANSRTIILLLDDHGTMPAPLAAEEEVKHALAISWSILDHTRDDHFVQTRSVPTLVDPYREVERRAVDVPPPK